MLSRSGPSGRLRCGLGAGPKSPTSRLPTLRRAPLIMVSIAFGLWIGALTALSIFDEAAGRIAS